MNFETKIFLMRQKFYMDLGMSITSLLIKVLMVVGIGAAINGVRPKTLFLFGIAYMIFTYLVGRIYVLYGWYTASLEVDNRLNQFQQEVRRELLKQKV